MSNKNRIQLKYWIFDIGYLTLDISHSQSGQSLVELMIGLGLLAILTPALLTGLFAGRQGEASEIQRAQAVTLLKEAQEAVRNIRESGWTLLPNDGSTYYHPVVSSGTWTLQPNPDPETGNGFTRQILFSDVCRDVTGKIAITCTGNAIDPSTKLVTTKVSWTQPTNSSIQSSMYLTRFRDNLTHLETTIPDFQGTVSNPSILNDTAIQATAGTSILNDGEVELGAGAGGSDWCKPANPVFAFHDITRSGVPNAIWAIPSATQNLAYITTGGNASGYVVDALTVSQTAPPVTPAIADPYFNNDNGAKAYGIFTDGTYVYFGGDKHTVQILNGTPTDNTSNLPSAGFFDVNGNGGNIKTGNSVYVSGSTGYVTVGSTLYSFDASTPFNGSSSQTPKGNTGLAGNGKRVVIVGTNAYVATDSTTSQLQIIPVSNGTFGTPKPINLGNGLSGVDVYVNSSQTYAYIVTAYAAGKNNFFIVDLTNTNNIYGYATVNGMNPKGVAVVSGNRALLVGSGGEEYEVFNTASPSAAFHCGGMSPTGTSSVNAVSPVFQGGSAYAYILTDNSSAEFQIILGGNGGQFPGLGVAGTFESAPFSPGYQTAFNRFTASVIQPAATNIIMKVSVEPAINGSCSGVTYSYVGPGGSSSAYFTPVGNTITASIPFGTYGSYQNPSGCFRYKVWFVTNDQTQTPVLNDATVNYSP